MITIKLRGNKKRQMGGLDSIYALQRVERNIEIYLQGEK